MLQGLSVRRVPRARSGARPQTTRASPTRVEEAALRQYITAACRCGAWWWCRRASSPSRCTRSSSVSALIRASLTRARRPAPGHGERPPAALLPRGGPAGRGGADRARLERAAAAKNRRFEKRRASPVPRSLRPRPARAVPRRPAPRRRLRQPRTRAARACRGAAATPTCRAGRRGPKRAGGGCARGRQRALTGPGQVGLMARATAGRGTGDRGRAVGRKGSLPPALLPGQAAQRQKGNRYG